jgi:hypothetical protein
VAFSDAATLAADTAWQGRVTACGILVANSVIGEAPGDPGAGDKIPHRRKRAALAESILTNPVGMTSRLAWDLAVATYAFGGAGSISDADLQAVARNVWDAMAGVSYEDRTGR